MSDIVVDASVAVKWFVPEEDSELADQLLNGDHRILAPRFLAVELVNAAWKNWRKNLLSADVVRDIAARHEDFIDEWRADETLLADATSLALALPHPLFDCLYLVLAQLTGTQVITADKRLLAIAPPGLAVALADWKG